MQDLTIFISHHPVMFAMTALILVSLAVVEWMRSKNEHYNVNVSKAIQLINHEKAVVIDIRQTDKYRLGHIIDAVSIPAKDLLASPQKLAKYKSSPLIIACQAGVESQKVAANLLKQGYNVYSLSGGLRAWTQEGMPVVKE